MKLLCWNHIQNKIIMPPTRTQHYLFLIIFRHKIIFVTSFTIFNWLKKYYYNILGGQLIYDQKIIKLFVYGQLKNQYMYTFKDHCKIFLRTRISILHEAIKSVKQELKIMLYSNIKKFRLFFGLTIIPSLYLFQSPIFTKSL